MKLFIFFIFLSCTFQEGEEEEEWDTEKKWEALF